MSASPANTPNQEATLETWPNNQPPTLGAVLASQPVADCKVAGSSTPLQIDGDSALASDNARALVELVKEFVLERELVAGLVSGWSWRILRSSGGGLLIHFCTRPWRLTE